MKFFDHWRDHALALFRIVIGLLFVIHGTRTVFGTFGAEAIPLTQWPYGPAGVVELAGGSLVLIGFGTRWAALISSGAMAYAYFVVHQPLGLFPITNGGELAAVYAWAFLLIAFTGAGTWSVDGFLAGRKAPQAVVTQPV